MIFLVFLQWCDDSKKLKFDLSKVQTPTTIYYGMQDFMTGMAIPVVKFSMEGYKIAVAAHRMQISLVYLQFSSKLLNFFLMKAL